MEAPKELFLHPNHKDEVGANWLTFPLTHSDVKYIRADLAELTWEDCASIMDAFFDFMQGIAAGRETPRHSKEELYKEVLRRFNEYKQNTREARSGTRKGKGI